MLYNSIDCTTQSVARVKNKIKTMEKIEIDIIIIYNNNNNDNGKNSYHCPSC